MKLKGKFKGTTINHRTGEIISWEKDNMITNAGLTYVANLMSDSVSRPSAISHIAFGANFDSTTKDMTALGLEVYRSEVTSTWDLNTGAITYSGAIPKNSGINLEITEAGLFNAAAGGVMFDRVTFKPKGIDEDMELRYEFTITLTA